MEVEGIGDEIWRPRPWTTVVGFEQDCMPKLLSPWITYRGFVNGIVVRALLLSCKGSNRWLKVKAECGEASPEGSDRLNISVG